MCVTHRQQTLFKAVLAGAEAPVHHVVHKVKMKQQAVCSPLPCALTLGLMARAMLQVAVLPDQEFRNYSIILTDGQFAPSPSLFAFGLLPNMNHKGNISSINIWFICLTAGDSTPVRPQEFEDCMAVWGDAEKFDYSGCPIYKSAYSKAYAVCGGDACLWYLLSFIKVLDYSYFQNKRSWVNGSV